MANFNHDLASLQGQVNRANNQVQQAQAAQQEAQTVQADVSAVLSDLSSLRLAVSRATGTSALGPVLAQERKDLARTLSDEQKVLGEAGHTDSGTLCYDAGTTSYDAGAVSYDLGTVKYDQTQAGSDASNISAAVQKLNNDMSVLDSDRANNSGDVPTNAPSNAQVASAIHAANAKIAGEKAAIANALSQARDMVKTAHAYAKQAQAACNAAGGG